MLLLLVKLAGWCEFVAWFGGIGVAAWAENREGVTVEAVYSFCLLAIVGCGRQINCEIMRQIIILNNG